MAYKNDDDRRAYQAAYYQAHKDTKKRAKTSNDAKRRWINANYSTVKADIPKDLAERFRAATAERGDSQASIIKAAIEAYLADK